MSTSLTPHASKDKRQAEIVDAWIARKGNGTLEAVTGFGKTRVAILIIKRMLRKDWTRCTVVVVPSLKLKEDWVKPLTGHIAVNLLTNVKVFVINSLIKHHQMFADLLVLDEVHNYAADQFYKVFSIVRYRWILGLTATIDRLDGKHNLLTAQCPVFAKVDMVEAQREGYISRFVTFNLAVKFSASEARLYEQLSNQMNAMFARFGQDFDLAKNCQSSVHLRESYAEQMGWNPSLGKDHDWSPQRISYYAVMWSRAIQGRKKLLYQSKSKLDAANLVLMLMPMKTITFSESTDFADELTRLHAATSRAYHSNIESTVETYEKVTSYKTKGRADKVEIKTRKVSGAMRNKRALLALSDPQSPVRIINTAKALDEGFDVEDIELALVCSSTSSTRQNIQRTGRAVRFVVGKLAVVINLYHPDTQDEKWLKARQAKGTSVWIQDPAEITRYLSGLRQPLP